ncbi:dickkopf-like protein 1 isoform 1-T5 [Liasis olivaceus]
MLLLVVVSGLWGLTSLKQGGTASATFLPSSMERLFREFSNIFEQSREMLGKDQFDTSVDISKLPSNYHHEENQRQRVGNSTLFRHHEIRKVTDNRTGDMMFSEKSMTSIEQTETHPDEEKDNKPMSNQEENSAELDRPTAGLRFFKLGLPQLRPRLTFLIFRLPQHLKSQQMPEAKLVKEEPISDRRHRLLAIRNGLLTAPHPTKKTLLVTPNHRVTPRKRHFFFFWRKM